MVSSIVASLVRPVVASLVKFVVASLGVAASLDQFMFIFALLVGCFLPLDSRVSRFDSSAIDPALSIEHLNSSEACSEIPGARGR